MKHLLVLLFITLVTLAHASGPGEKPKKERRPPQWDTLYFKNELSLDIGWPVDFLLSSNVQSGVLALSYQRALTKRDFLRISTRHGFQNTSTTTDNILDNTNSLPPANFQVPDSVFTKTGKTYRYYSPDIRVGYEHRFGKRRIKGILGMDALFGAEIEHTSYQYRYFKPELVSNGAGGATITMTEIIRNPQLAVANNVNLKEGMAPFVGMFVHLSKRFSMRATMMYDIYWAESVHYFTDSPALAAPGGYSFNVGAKSFIADLSLTAHF